MSDYVIVRNNTNSRRSIPTPAPHGQPQEIVLPTRVDVKVPRAAWDAYAARGGVQSLLATKKLVIKTDRVVRVEDANVPVEKPADAPAEGSGDGGSSKKKRSRKSA